MLYYNKDIERLGIEMKLGILLAQTRFTVEFDNVVDLSTFMVNFKRNNTNAQFVVETELYNRITNFIEQLMAISPVRADDNE